jgi:uncharacterized membrane protein
MTHAYGFHFSQPWWLIGWLLVVPVIWLGVRNLSAIGPVRRRMAIVLRCLVVLILVGLLGRPVLTRQSRTATVIVVLDRSLSIPQDLQKASLEYLKKALGSKTPKDLLAVVDVAEAASISKLPSGDTEIPERNTSLTGEQSRLADGIQMAMAIAPPDAAVRILLISEGNETAGDLKEAARVAGSNGIPIDVLPLRYEYDKEVLFKRLAGPSRARSGQTVSLRFVLNSTTQASGKILLNLNGKPVDLSPGSPELTVDVDLKPGTNVKTVSLPVGTRGMHEFVAEFIPDGPDQDRIAENNRASAMTYVAGPGHVLVADSDGASATALVRVMQGTDMDVRYVSAAQFPDNLAQLIDCDAAILVNTDCGSFTYQQQEMLCRYVKDIGGGLIMVGGPNAFGAGGWIGSPVAEVIPVDLDPPQKKQLPKGALVLIMHACEMPQGNLWGKRVALAAVNTLSRRDLAGILAYNWQWGGDWVFPLSAVGDKQAINAAISNMQMGDMPSLHAHLQQAYEALSKCDAAQKHVIIISDGDPTAPTAELLAQCKQAGITCTGVGIFPHSPADVQSLLNVAQATGGRFYNVKDPQQLPQIFIKEAQVVRRALIVEETFTPKITYGLSEIVSGLPMALPSLDGYVLTGPKGGLNQVVISSTQDDPVLATCQAGLGRCVVFTSSADSRWASSWLSWGGMRSFWEQTVRWVAKPGQASDCEIFADVQGRQVTVSVEAVDAEGKFVQFAGINGQVISPDMSTMPIQLNQIGPGQYQGRFEAASAGSYIIALRSRKLGADGESQITHTAVTIPFAPEFRDLRDNAPLLAEVSEITQGRILVSDPNQANLYEYAGLKFPQAQLPLIRPLMFIWLALFLLDVAVRRVVVDFRDIASRVVKFVRAGRGQRQVEQTLDRLQAARQKLWKRLAAGPRDVAASRRYEAGKEFAGDLPRTEPVQKTEQPAAKQPAVAAKPKPEFQQDSSHIQRLLRAKRKAIERPDDHLESGNE